MLYGVREGGVGGGRGGGGGGGGDSRGGKGGGGGCGGGGGGWRRWGCFLFTFSLFFSCTLYTIQLVEIVHILPFYTQ